MVLLGTDKHGNLVTDRRLVMRRYLHSTRLWWDVLSVLPVDLIQLLFWREYMGITKVRLRSSCV